MKELIKNRYISCELKVIQFQVEQGFATSNFEANTSASQVYNSWSMTAQNSQYRNQGYNVQGFNWGGDALPNTNNN